MPVKQAVPTWKTVAVDDPDALRQLEEKEELDAEVRIRDAVRELEKAGIIDSKGRRISHDLPPDMREGSGCEV
jgi:hypothetical protein